MPEFLFVLALIACAIPVTIEHRIITARLRKNKQPPLPIVFPMLLFSSGMAIATLAAGWLARAVTASAASGSINPVDALTEIILYMPTALFWGVIAGNCLTTLFYSHYIQQEQQDKIFLGMFQQVASLSAIVISSILLTFLSAWLQPIAQFLNPLGDILSCILIILAAGLVGGSISALVASRIAVPVQGS